ncbi:MAG: IPT/TIG domain-containing protein, partial [Leptothrix ochracea]|uniref:IPT/TIG domain-containing protein n=1 Tax=Leptothrix ochracea TaxID=735331 RepID=UPI0034E21A97
MSIPANAAFPLIIEAGLVGERYYDENTGAMTLITTSGVTASGAAIRALIADVTNLNATSSVGVTPFTEMAVTSLQNISGVLPTGTALTAVSAVAANNAIGNAFAMSNVLLAPTLVNTSAVLTALPANEAGQYAAKLAGLARMANTPVKGGTAPTTGEDALRAANRLRDDLINGRITPNQLATQLNAAMTANVSGVAIANATAAQLPVPAAAMTWTHVQDVANFAVGEMNKALNGKATQAQIIAAIQNAANQAWAGLQTALNGAGANPNLANLLAQVKGNTTTGINTAAATFSPTISLVSVSGVNANSGVAAATGAVGDTVSIMGTGFDAFSQHNIVKFSGTQATHTAASGTSGVLVVTVPAGAVTGPLTVTNFMTNATTPAFSFTVPGTAIANCPAGQTLNPLMQCVAAGTGG